MCTLSLTRLGFFHRLTYSRLQLGNVTQRHASMSSLPIFPSENPKGPCPFYLYEPPEDAARAGAARGLIVLQEWWGVTEIIKETAKTLATEGMTTLVPDLYRGKLTDDYEEAGHYMHGLDWPGAVKDIQGAAQYLLQNGCKKAGVTGFCMGGALSFAAAALVPEISASAPFYGIPAADLADLSIIKVPLQAHFGEEDTIVGFSSKQDAEKLKEKLGDKMELFLYPKCGHAFMNKSGPNYNEEMARVAQERLVKFMKAHL